MATIYVVEDDQNIREIESFALKNSGYEVEGFACAADFYKRVERVLPDLVLLDIMLPDKDGLDILKDLRARVETRRLPIIMVTAKTTEIDKVKGLDQGADDYLTKPFGVMELISRVKALLRRTNGIQEDAVLQFQGLQMDLEKHRVSVEGQPVELTFKEFELLRIFMQNAGIVLQRETLMNKVWGTDYEGESRTLDMHIKTLRQKIGDYGNHIKTVRNVGYRLE
mgnify:FL=1